MGYLVGCDSPNQAGAEGTDSEEVWMITDPSAILVICTSLKESGGKPRRRGKTTHSDTFFHVSWAYLKGRLYKAGHYCK
jgi:hypothetical protein